MSIRTKLLTLSGFALVSACQAAPPPLETVDYVDLERFMGPWYVIANIPTFLEKGAHNAVETYTLNDDGTIATRFTYLKGGFDGKQKEFNPKAFILDDTNARWGMRFVWPIKADYRIVYVNDDYSQTVIARQKRDFVWIMAKSPSISDDDYNKLEAMVADLGYDTTKLLRIPQRW